MVVEIVVVEWVFLLFVFYPFFTFVVYIIIIHIIIIVLLITISWNHLFMNNHPITIPIPLISYGGMDHIGKSERICLRWGYL